MRLGGDRSLQAIAIVPFNPEISAESISKIKNAGAVIRARIISSSK
jgi:hypothetical protein